MLPGDKTRVRQFFHSGSYLSSLRPQIRLRAELIRTMLGDLEGKRILDIGCGDGSISLQFAKTNHLTLVDFAESMLLAARERTPPDAREHVRFVLSDIDAFQTEAPFDVVLCIGVLAHVPSVDAAMTRLASLVAPGGSLVLQLTDHDHPLTKIQLRSRFLRPRASIIGYELTPTRKVEILASAARLGLQPVEERRYWPSLRGMSRLPAAWVYQFERWTASVPMVARMGAESLFLLQKRSAPSEF